jgi:hypothetical protein
VLRDMGVAGRAPKHCRAYRRQCRSGRWAHVVAATIRGAQWGGDTFYCQQAPAMLVRKEILAGASGDWSKQVMMRAYDREALRHQFSIAEPFRFIKIDDLFDPTFARAVAAAYSSFEVTLAKGRAFKAINERKKVQITEASVFPGPVAQLNKLLASAEFLAGLSFVTGIPSCSRTCN